MSAAATPRPRPKPRKKVSNQPSQASSSSQSTTSKTNNTRQAVDDDEHFFKNRNRTSATWKKLEKVTQADEAVADDDDVFNEDYTKITTTHRKKHTQELVPDWDEKIRLLSVDVTSDDDDDIEFVAQSSPRKRARKGVLPNPEQRRRSRSRSITPPPDLSHGQIQALDGIVRRAFNRDRRSQSPVVEISSEEEDVSALDPELQRIRQNMDFQNQKVTEERSGSSVHVPSSPISGSKEEVTLHVKWISHPLNQSGKGAKWAFKTSITDNFYELFDSVADLTSVLVDTLIVTYNRQRIFPSSTPKSLDMRGSADLEACEKQTYDYLREQRYTSPPVTGSTTASKEQGASRSNSVGPDDSGGEEEAGCKLKLILRSEKSKKNVTLNVRTTTTCGAIVRAFMKSAGLSGDALKGRISIDGDKLSNDTEIGEADVEDGDMVEVVGL